MNLLVKETADGSKTLYLPDMDESYHSVRGAVSEAKYVFLKNGYDFHNSSRPVVFEVGFGTGLNALITACRATEYKRNTFYISVDKYPLDNSYFKEMKYGEFMPDGGSRIYEEICFCEWETPVEITPWFTLLKVKADLTLSIPSYSKLFDVIYFDAFGPDKQPEMWSEKIFAGLYGKLSVNGVLVTYSAKGDVRRRLLSSGFKVERLPGPLGKREMLRGIKTEFKT